MEHEFNFPIKYVTRHTGLSSYLIRAWEKRYGAVKPARTETNRRRYSQDDIARLMLLKKAVGAGIPIGDVAQLETAALERLVKAPLLPSPMASFPQPSEPESQSQSNHLDACVGAVLALDPRALETALHQSLVGIDKNLFIDRVIAPLMQIVGDLWKEGQVRVAHEHMATAVVRTFLGDMLRFVTVSETGPICLFTTPAGQHHELGALMAAVTGALQDWRSIYLGPDVPADEIAAATQRTGATLVGLSIIYPADDPALEWELQRLRRGIAEEVAVLAGGRAAPYYADAFRATGVSRLGNPAALRRMLWALRS